MATSIVFQEYKSPFGSLKIADYNGKLVICDWSFRKKRKELDHKISSALNAEFQPGSSPIIKETIQQLDAYSKGELKSFNVPIQLVGSDFQKNVWNHLLKIPYGETRSYSQLSKEMDNPKAIRAVASANGAYSIAIIVPCHRIIGANGDLIGYAGSLNTKKKLLKLEGSLPHQNQLSLF